MIHAVTLKFSLFIYRITSAQLPYPYRICSLSMPPIATVVMTGMVQLIISIINYQT